MNAERRLLLGAGLLLAATASPISAQTIVTDRPDFTESTATVPDGRFQLEAGYTWATLGDWTTHEIGEALVRWGLIPGLELRAGIPSYLIVSEDGVPAGADADRSGLGDASIGMKLGLYESGMAEGLPSVALVLGSSLPTGNDEVTGTDGWEPEAILALGWSFTPSLSLGANIGYAQRSFVGLEDSTDEFFTSIAAGFPLVGGLNGFAEYFAIRPDLDGADQDYIDGGVTYLLSPTLQLDARVGIGVADTDDAMFFGFGIAKLF